MSNNIQQYLNSAIRRTTRNGETFFSLVDITAQFADTQQAARQYWNDTKKRLEEDGFQVSEKILQLKLKARDGKLRATDCADAETCLRIVQSIPSAKAEPIRQWLAQVGHERLQEVANPELGVERAQGRAITAYENAGKDAQWIATRLKSIDDRKVFTDALAKCITDMTGQKFGAATNAVYKGLWQRDAETLRKQMGIWKGANLRDAQPGIALKYQSIVEEVIAIKLGNAQQVAWSDAVEIIDFVAKMIGVQAAEVTRMLGVDLATGKVLLR